MYKVVFGNKNVGIQGIYFFNNQAYAEKFAHCVKKVLDSVRNGTDEWKDIASDWYHDMALFNFLLEMANRAMLEKEDPSIWINEDFESGEWDEMYNGEAWVKFNKEDEKIDNEE